jgi:hypothetical protein
MDDYARIKIQNLHTFINNQDISFNDLYNIAYKINTDHICEKCYSDYQIYEKIKKPIESISRKKNISVDEAVIFLKSKNVISDNLIDKFTILKTKFYDGIMGYCHYNTLISFKKLENLLKTKLKKNYKVIFNKIKFDYPEFYTCPYFEKPKKNIKINIFKDINQKIPFISKNLDKEDSYNPNDFEFCLPYNPSVNDKITWEKKKTNYVKKTNEPKVFKRKKTVNSELNVNYNNFLVDEINDLLIDLNYIRIKEHLIEKKYGLERIYNSEFSNIFIERELFHVEKKLHQEYSDSYLQESTMVENRIDNILRKNLNYFVNDNIPETSEIFNLNQIINVIKDLKYNILYGREILKACSLVNNNYRCIDTVINKIDHYKYLKSNFMKSYEKIKKNNVVEV